MKKEKVIIRDNKKVIMLSLLIIVTFGLLVFTSFRLYESLNTKEEESLVNNNRIYATVLEVGENYVKIQELNSDNVYVISTGEKLEDGDLVVVYEEDVKKQESVDVEVMASKSDLITIDTDVSVTTTTTTNVVTTNKTTLVTTKTTNKTSSSVTSTITTKTTIGTDDEVVSYFSNEYSTISSYSDDASLKEKAKEKFILIVDFIFYDTEIKGKKFSDLTDSAKAKIIYYTLLIDQKIDSKWPNYKDSISSKYNDIKNKLIAKYLDLSSSLCDSNLDTCADFKRDFNLLKSSIGLTWDVIKGCFKYVYNMSKEKLVLWYEMFSGKI